MTNAGQDMSTTGTPVESDDRPPPEGQRQPDPPQAPSVAVRPAIGMAWLRGLFALPAFVVVGVLGAIPFGLVVGTSAPGKMVILGASAASAAACIAYVLVAWHFTSAAPLSALGLGRMPAARFLQGLVAGLLLMGAVVGIGIVSGAWRLRLGLPSVLPFVATTAVLLLAAFWEEIGFRGYMLQESGRRSLRLGFAWSVFAFTLMHLANPGALASPVARVLVPANIALAGILLGATFLLAGDLWWPWGLHFGWNWAQACVFGLKVSGFELPSLLRGEPAEGRAWLTGGAFGPEGSIIATGVLVVGNAALLALIVRGRPVLPVVAFDRAAAEVAVASTA